MIVESFDVVIIFFVVLIVVFVGLIYVLRAVFTRIKQSIFVIDNIYTTLVSTNDVLEVVNSDILSLSENEKQLRLRIDNLQELVNKLILEKK